MKIAYYLNEGRGKNLYCRINDGEERVTFSLGHYINPKEWNAKREEGSSDDAYYYTLMTFKDYLKTRYHELKSAGKEKVLSILKNEATAFVDDSGIEGVARNMFDNENQKDGVYKYDDFLKAFEIYSDLKKGQYQAQAVGTLIVFKTDSGEEYEMDTYEGKTALLKSFIDRRSYDEIYTMTNENFWSEIYIDAGIEKHVFVPTMLGEWERYWENLYKRINESVGNTEHLEERKNSSWRAFQVFMECYDSCGDCIELAYDISDMELYPIAVITMMNIFDAETCYSEYCEFEFNNGDWETICLNDRDDSPIFYIKPAEY